VGSLQFLSDGMADLSSYGSSERDEQVSFTSKLSFLSEKFKRMFGLVCSRKILELLFYVNISHWA